jgi:hypothetical protein
MRAVKDADDADREYCARLIAQHAAALVAAGMDRRDAIEMATEGLRKARAAEDDATGVGAIENVHPCPSKASPPDQVAAIAAELLDAARDAARSL